MVSSRVRRPSVSKASRVPTPGKSTSSGFASAGATTSCAVLAVARRARVLLDHVDGREDRAVLPRPLAHLGQAAHLDQRRVDLVEAPRGAGDQRAAHARHDAAVDDRRDAARAGEVVQLQGILGEEGDVHDVAACLEDGAQGLEAEETGHRADDEVEAPHQFRDDAGVGEVATDGGEARAGEAREGLLVAVGDGDLETGIGGEIAGHGAADQTGAEHDDFHDADSSLGSMWTSMRSTPGSSSADALLDRVREVVGGLDGEVGIRLAMQDDVDPALAAAQTTIRATAHARDARGHAR